MDADSTMFRMQGKDRTMIVSLYVDNGLVTHDSDIKYARFIKALSTKFELSDDTAEVSWYLGVSVIRDYVKGTIKLSQKQYINNLLT